MPATSKDASHGKETVEETLAKIAALLGDTAKKDDIDGLKTQIINFTTTTNEEIVKLKHSINAVETKSNEQQDQIVSLQASVEILKQDQLKTNISVAGIPAELMANSNADDIIIKIALKLGVVIEENQFTSHTVANHRFVIAHFHNLHHKQKIMNQLKVGKILCVKDIFANASTNNSRIFVNDHLTPYFNKLYLIARNAKKERKLYSASSSNGRIRVRKFNNDLPIVITSEQQLNLLINVEASDAIELYSENSQLVEEPNNASTSTQKNDKRSPIPKRNGKSTKNTEKRRRNKSQSKSPNQSDSTNNNSKRNRSGASSSASSVK